MDLRYVRNQIFINEEEQEAIRNYPILLAGSGIGSVIAECALRFGFENMTIIDGDHVEVSNLNRQNYTETDVASMKVQAIRKRLLEINKDADIKVISSYLTEDNLTEFIGDHKVAVNALDFSSDVPLQFDSICQRMGINVLHPYNLGWGGAVAVIRPNGPALDLLANGYEKDFSELNVVNYMSSYLRFWGDPEVWLEEVIEDYESERVKLSPPQLSIGSWTVAAMCTNILFRICTRKEIKEFPEFYFSTMTDN